MKQELKNLTGCEAIQKIKDGEMSVHEYCNELLNLSESQKYLNAFITLDKDYILQQAKQIDEKIKNKTINMHGLYGLPICVKDNMNIKGIKTTGGTPFFKDFYPQTSSPVVQSILDSNGIIFGKTNLHELAFGITSNNTIFGPVRNPYNPELIPGGSSGGTAAAVTSRIIPMGFGTDTGGSVRIPASLCGCVGFRPTTLRYSQCNVIPITTTKDTIGIFGRTVSDVILLDSFSTSNKNEDINNDINQINLNKLRVGVPRRYYYQDLDNETAIVMEEALVKLKNAGIVLIEQDMDQEIERLVKELFNIVGYEAVRTMSTYLKENGFQESIEEFIETIHGETEKGIYKMCMNISQKEYEDLITIKRPQLQKLYKQYLEDNNLDCFVIPTTRITARKIGEDKDVLINGKLQSYFTAYVCNTEPSSIVGAPAISIPAGLTAISKLPVGLELASLPSSDISLLHIASYVESILGTLPPPPTDFNQFTKN